MMSSVSIRSCAFQLGQIIPEGVRHSRIWEWILPNGEFSVGKLINLCIASHADSILQLSISNSCSHGSVKKWGDLVYKKAGKKKLGCKTGPLDFVLGGGGPGLAYFCELGTHAPRYPWVLTTSKQLLAIDSTRPWGLPSRVTCSASWQALNPSLVSSWATNIYVYIYIL